MLRLALAIFALVALARAQTNCTGIEGCSKNTGSCGDLSLTISGVSTTVPTTCAEGTYCTGSTCALSPTIGEACSVTEPCWDPNWTGITCSSSLCVWVDIYGPGESCNSASSYLNGGCLAGQNCSTTCSSISAGSNTSAPSSAYCAPNTYSNGTNCVAQLGAGTNCQANYQCQPGLVCSNNGGSGSATCQTPFSVASGSSCSSVFDCQANLRCLSGTCTPVPKTGESCQSDSDCQSSPGDSGVFCECESSTTSAKDPNVSGSTVAVVFDNTKSKCEDGLEHFSSSEQSAFKKIQACALANNCNDLFKLAAAGIDLSGPGQCIYQCLQSAYETGFEKEGLGLNSCSLSGGSSSGGVAVVLPSVVVISSFVLAALL